MLTVGVFLRELAPRDGGGFTFQESIRRALRISQGNHNFICLSEREAQDNDAMERQQLDLMWFLGPGHSSVRIPYITTVWDLQHRVRPYFPEVSTTGWTWEARDG